MPNHFNLTEDVMAFVERINLGNAQLNPTDDVVTYAAHIARLDETEFATRSLMTRQLEKHATNTTFQSPTPSVSLDSIPEQHKNNTGMVFGVIIGGGLALALIGCVVFACRKMMRGEPVFSMSGHVAKKEGDVENAAGNNEPPPESGAGRFY
jgi:hypothetical protein